jgi:hypothetical protein
MGSSVVSGSAHVLISRTGSSTALLWTDALLAAAMGAASVLWFEAVKFSRRKAER